MPEEKPKQNKKIAEAPFDTPNLVSLVDKDTLKNIGRKVDEDFDSDLRSRTDWAKRRAEWLKLYMGHVDVKSFPWQDSANVPVPLLTTSVIQFQARAYDALMPAKNKMRVNYTGDEDIPRAERVGKHMNYQLDYEMEDYEGGWDKTLFQLPIDGSAFRKIYYDPINRRNKVLNCSTDEVVVPYKTSPNEKPLRITHVLYMTPNDLRIREKLGVYADTWDLGPGSDADINVTTSEIKTQKDLIEGIMQSQLPENKPRVILEQHGLWDLDGDGIKEPYVITIDREKKRVLRIIKRYFIQKGFVHEIDYFEHYKFWENPEGYYGLGFGHVLEGINAAAKAILDQIIDAGTLANTVGGFINARSGVKKGTLAWKMGELKNVEVNADDIRKAIYLFDFKGPSTVLFSVLGLLQDYGTRVTTVSETMTGELPRSDTPATAIVNAVEQGMKVFSTIHKRIHRAFKSELRKLYMWNGINANQENYMRVLGDRYIQKAQQDGIQIDITADYTGDLDIQPVSDPNIISKAEKMAVAEQSLTHTMQNPATAQDPEVRREAYKRFYEALGVPDIEKLLEKPPPPPPDFPPEQENSMMLREQSVQALEQQDHIAHVNSIDDFKQTVFFNKDMTPHGKNLLDAHRLEHLSFQYLKENQGQQGQQPPTQMGAIA